jgi:uncharacterized protein (TIGR02646 family)
MKRVTKQQSPELFESWKAQESEDWRPTFEGLQKPEKPALLHALLSEQGWVCCYCGRAVSMIESHIEHFRPQVLRADLELAYENLHASCIPETSPGMPLHCGHAKGHGFDEDRHISPLDAGCEERFLYTLRGEVLAADRSDSAAEYMLDLLALDIPFLRNRREEALSIFSADFLNSVTAQELLMLRDAFRRPDAQGRAPSFGHVVARYAEQCLSDSTAANDNAPAGT